MRNLLTTLILFAVVFTAQAQKLKSGIIGKWQMVKTEYYNEKGKLLSKKPASDELALGNTVSYIFKKNETCEYHSLGQFDADIRKYDYLVDSEEVIIIDQETFDIIWRFQAILSKDKKNLIFITDFETGTQKQFLTRK